jgi:hypothetical protein
MLERFSRAGARTVVVLRSAGRNGVAWWRQYRLGRLRSSHANCGGRVAEIVAPRTGSLDALAVENLIQALLLTAREPVALELAGWPDARRLLVRATTERSLVHLCAQIRAHAPQAQVRLLAPSPTADAGPRVGEPPAPAAPRGESSHVTDPLVVREIERSITIELRPRGAAHLPIKLYRQDELGAPGVDPQLGVLAAMDMLPPGGRVVAQLALASAPESWSRDLQRLAVEHPLAQEQARAAARGSSASSSTTPAAGAGLPLLPILILIGAVALARLTHLSIHVQRGNGLWPGLGLIMGAGTLHRGSVPSGMLVLVSCALVLLLLGLMLWVRTRLLRRPVYDMRLVGERTARIAARVRLTVIAIGPLGPLGSTGPAPVAAGVPRVTTEPQFLMSAAARADRGWSWLKWRALAGLARRIPAAPHSDRALRDVLDHVAAAYRQHALASGNGFVAHRLSARRATTLAARWPRRVRRSPHLLNARELAALWHLPAGEAQVPLLERTRARTLLAPASPLARGYRLGVSTAAGHTVPVCLPPEALRRNALLIAKTGKGKSSLLLHLARAHVEGGDIHTPSPAGGAGAGGQAADAAPDPPLSTAERAGLVVVDPHGDLVAALLGLVPPAARERVVLVDLADTAYPVALNPLDVVLGRDRDKAVESLLQILSQIWARFWGPRMQNALEYALKTLYEANEALVSGDPQEGPDQQFTLLDVAPLLSAPDFREDVLHQIHDSSLLTWWNHYYKPLDARLKVEIINPVLTKLASFSGSRVARRIVGQGRSTLDLPEIVREGRLLLVNTARGVVGAETATLVGATLLGALQFTLEEQARLAAGQRRRLLVLVDEFQTLRGVDYGAMLAELRKFGGTFALATQALAHLDALDPTLRPTVLANVDALYVFATSAEDARALVHELDDAVEIADIINQDDFTCYAKLALDGRRLPPFTLALDPPPAGDPVLAEQIRGRARTRYGRPVQAVEDDLAQAARRYQPSTDRVAPVGSAGASHPVIQSGETSAADPQRSPSGRGRYGQRRRGPKATSSAPMDELWAGILAAPTSSTAAAHSAQARPSAFPSKDEPASNVAPAPSGRPLDEAPPSGVDGTSEPGPPAAVSAPDRHGPASSPGDDWAPLSAFDGRDGREGHERGEDGWGAWDEDEKEDGQ